MHQYSSFNNYQHGDFPCGPVVNKLPCNAGNMDWIPGGELRFPCCEATKKDDTTKT